MNIERASFFGSLVSALLFAVITPIALATESTQPSSFPDTGHLGSQWWQLVMSIPGAQSPFLDQTGASCGIGQRGQTWFLYSSSLGPRVDIKCTVPAGKTLFLPVVAGICIAGPEETIEEQFELCKEGSDVTDFLSVKLDGVDRKDLIERRASSRAFTLVISKDDEVFGFPPGEFFAVHDGFFAKIPPLAPGRHRIRVRGGISSFGYSTDTLFDITIVKPAARLPATSSAARVTR